MWSGLCFRMTLEVVLNLRIQSPGLCTRSPFNYLWNVGCGLFLGIVCIQSPFWALFQKWSNVVFEANWPFALSWFLHYLDPNVKSTTLLTFNTVVVRASVSSSNCTHGVLHDLTQAMPQKLSNQVLEYVCSAWQVGAIIRLTLTAILMSRTRTQFDLRENETFQICLQWIQLSEYQENSIILYT